MALTDAERFAKDLADDESLRDAIKTAATGLASIVEFAKSRGYDFTIDEAKEYIQSRAPQELTDEQLEAVTGGKGGGSSTSSTVVQTAGVATSAAEAAEVATTAVQVTEGAADVAAAAEVVAVAAAAVVLT